MSKLRQRFLLVSDMHYTTDLSYAEYAARHPGARASAASGSAFGKTQREKVEKVYSDIAREHSEAPLDAVLVLGDLSVDDYDFRRFPENYCKKFKEECMDRLPCPAYAIPGNHDSYPDEIWHAIFGYDREYVLPIGDTVFIMADNFADLPANPDDPAAGSKRTPLSENLLEEAARLYPGKRYVLCSHYLTEESFSDKCRRMVRDWDELLIMYTAHTHVQEVTDMGDEFGGKRLVDIGGYGYSGKRTDSGWVFDIYDYAWGWGYQILEVYDDKIRTYHTKTDMRYIARNGEFETRRKIVSDFSISFKNTDK